MGATSNPSLKALRPFRVLIAVAAICAGVGLVPVVLPVSTSASSHPCSEGGACVVGDTGPGGGIVFYVHDSGTFACGASMELLCSYLEAAPTSGTNAWTDVQRAFSGTTDQWLLSNGALGYGYKNTTDFVAQNSTAGRAITSARAYRGPNDLSDWFLPSQEELQYLYVKKDVVGGLQASLYKASSGCCSKRLSGVDFGTGAVSQHVFKSDAHYVRPIRAFSVLETPATTSTTVAPTTTTVAPTTTTTVTVVTPTSTPLLSRPSPTSTSTTAVSVVAPVSPVAVMPNAETIRRLPSASPALLTVPELVAGSFLSVTLRGFGPNELVYMLVASEPQVLGIAQADAAGEVSISGQLPTGLTGDAHTLAVFAPESGTGFSQSISVAAAVLPNTGPSAPMVPLAILGIAVGLLASHSARGRGAVTSAPD
jgi:hypothetical protein